MRYGAEYNMMSALRGNFVYAQGGQKSVYSTARKALFAKLKSEGVTGVKSYAGLSSIIKNAKQSGKWGDLAPYFRKSSKTESGYEYNYSAIAEDLYKHPDLAMKAGVTPKEKK